MGIPQVPVVRMRIEELAPHPANPRMMTRQARQALGASLREFGLVQSLVWNRRTGKLLGGHRRVEELRAAGEDEADVHVVDLDEARERLLLVQLNDRGSQGANDPDRLAAIVASLRMEVPDLLAQVSLADLGRSAVDAFAALTAGSGAKETLTFTCTPTQAAFVRRAIKAALADAGTREGGGDVTGNKNGWALGRIAEDWWATRDA